MFERYTEPARRVVFFARYEASQFGSAAMESEHFLLGLLREDEKVLQRFIPNSTTIEAIRRQVEDQVPVHEKTPTTIDIPLSEECVRILDNTAEESKELGHPNIDTRHLLLGILREENCLASRILRGLGLELEAVREEVRQMPKPEAASGSVIVSFGSSAGEAPLPAAGVVPDADTAMRIAEAVWVSRVSTSPDDRVVAQNATLTFGVWIVEGFHHSGGTDTALAAFIQKADGKILRLHQQKADA